MTMWGKNGEGMQLYTNQPYLPLIDYFSDPCEMPQHFFFHSTVLNRGRAVGFLIMIELTHSAVFYTPIFTILNGLTGMTRRSINGYLKRAFTPIRCQI